MNTLNILKQNNEDFEWYPTTEEIINKVKSRMTYGNRYSINSILDIGTGDGRVLKALKDATSWDKELYGIEKAKSQQENLIKQNIKLLGLDFFETCLVDRKFGVAFCNPPYSQFKEFCTKICKEITAEQIFLVIPKRWKDDKALLKLINEKGVVEVLHNFDFLDADRKARCVVDLILITEQEDTQDCFTKWIEDNIGTFDKCEELAEETLEELFSEEIEQREGNDISILVQNYEKELNHLLQNFKKINEIDFNLLKNLGLNKETIISKIKNDIKGLKNIYWQKTFDCLKTITDRLTSSSRDSILNDITWFKELDFNYDNIHSIVIWIIDNYNKYTSKQLITLFDKLTDPQNIKAYKSNRHWKEDDWRFTRNEGKGKPEKYLLDYRIVVPDHKFLSYYSWEKNRLDYDAPYRSVPADLKTIAKTFGFNCYMHFPRELSKSGQTLYCEHSDNREGSLFEVKAYYNKNLHFKIDKELMKRINVEVGKIRGWIRNYEDVMLELELDEEEAKKLYNSSIMLTTNDIKLLN